MNFRCGPGKATPIFAAFRKGHLDLVRTLITAGADFSVLDGDGQAVIHECVTTGAVDDVRKLVRLGADLNVRDRDGFTSLMRCAERPRSGPEIASVLLDGGADWSPKLLSGETALMIATCVGNVGVVRALLGAGASTSSKVNGGSPMHEAASKGNADIVQLLREAGAEVDVATGNNNPPLIVAAENGQAEMVRLLCETGADPNVVDTVSGHNLSALGCAARSGHVGVVRELVKAGADVNKGPGPASPLYAACFGRHLEIVRDLVRAGASPLLDPDYALTALHMAAEFVVPKLALVLLEEGCLETAEDSRGNTPADVIEVRRRPIQGYISADERHLQRLLARGPAFRARSWLWPTNSGKESTAGGATDHTDAAIEDGLSATRVKKKVPVAVSALRHRRKDGRPFDVMEIVCR